MVNENTLMYLSIAAGIATAIVLYVNGMRKKNRKQREADIFNYINRRITSATTFIKEGKDNLAVIDIENLVETPVIAEQYVESVTQSVILTVSMKYPDENLFERFGNLKGVHGEPALLIYLLKTHPEDAELIGALTARVADGFLHHYISKMRGFAK